MAEDWHKAKAKKILTKLWRHLKRIEKLEEGGKEFSFKTADILEYREYLGYLLDCNLCIHQTERRENQI